MVISSLATLGATVRRTITESATDTPIDRFATVAPTLALLRAYAKNDIYDDVAMWQSYKSKYRLPRSLRSIYNPTHRAISWYANHVFRGDWTEDGKPTPDGKPHLFRFPADVLASREPLIAAFLQIFDWGKWPTGYTVYVNEGATVGSVFVEVVDDKEGGKVYPVIHPLENLADISLDASGHVKAFDLQYLATDDPWDAWEPSTRRTAKEAVPFRYRKVVTPDWIVQWRDDEITFEAPNLYGFVPAVFVKHRDRGGLFGAPVIDGVIPKIDEANRLATGIHNYVAKLQSQPQIIASNSQPVPLAGQAKGAETLTDEDMARFQELIPWMWTNDTDTKSFPLMQPVPVEGASSALANLLAEIESDLPEVTVDRELRAMSQVTGPGAQRLVSDAVGRLEEAQANYVRGIVAIGQMGVSIAGWRFNTGAWGRGAKIDRKQAKFASFTLESFKNGSEDIMLGKAPLFDETDLERFQALAIKKDLAGLPDEAIQKELGYDDAARAEFNAAADKAAARFQVANGLTPFEPAAQQPGQQPAQGG